jgi:hypothetical protein
MDGKTKNMGQVFNSLAPDDMIRLIGWWTVNKSAGSNFVLHVQLIVR